MQIDGSAAVRSTGILRHMAARDYRGFVRIICAPTGSAAGAITVCPLSATR